MARASKKKDINTVVPVDEYHHDGKTRLNNPPVGLAHLDRDVTPMNAYEYDPRLDPSLNWTGKSERERFEIPAPSIHIHEELSAARILRSVRSQRSQAPLFPVSTLSTGEAADFYQYPVEWRNRMILGDSLVAMNSLLERERLGGQVQMAYMDPPYGIGYNSNFQADLTQHRPREGLDDTLTREPEMIQAYRDTWRLGVHSYLTYLRDRFYLARELLAESGSIFVQISQENLHYVQALLNEVFGSENFITIIWFKKKKMPLGETFLFTPGDYIVWYAKDRKASSTRFRRLFQAKSIDDDSFNYLELPDGSRLSVAEHLAENHGELLPGARRFQSMDLRSSGRTESCVFPVEFDGRVFNPGQGRSWKTNREGMERLLQARRLFAPGDTLRYVLYLDDYPVSELSNIWDDTQGATDPIYVVQTSTKVVERCMLMTTDPGDLVLDPTCGSGTTAYVAEQWGRRWITTDTSRVALSLARERLLSAVYPSYRLADAGRGLSGGLQYKSVAHLTLGSISQEKPSDGVILYDQPEVDSKRVRVSGSFTVEALSQYSINPLSEDNALDAVDDGTSHIELLLAALERLGVPRPGKSPLPIESLTRIAAVGSFQAESFAVTEAGRVRVGICLGPRFGSINMSLVSRAAREAVAYDLVVFVGFAADADTQNRLASGKLGSLSVALLLANPNLLLGDLLKNTQASQTFRLYASPDITLDATGEEKWTVRVNGLDSYDASTGELQSYGQERVVCWFLDEDYDGEIFRASQAFFPVTDAWEHLRRALNGTVDAELIAGLGGWVSLPFQTGEHRKCAVRTVTVDGNAAEVIHDLPKPGDNGTAPR